MNRFYADQRLYGKQLLDGHSQVAIVLPFVLPALRIIICGSEEKGIDSMAALFSKKWPLMLNWAKKCSILLVAMSCRNFATPSVLQALS